MPLPPFRLTLGPSNWSMCWSAEVILPRPDQLYIADWLPGQLWIHWGFEGWLRSGTRYHPMKKWPGQTRLSWPLTPWVRWWAWGRGEVEVEDRSQIFCASVLPNIWELLSNQQVNVARWGHLRLVPVWRLWLMYRERNWGCCWGQLESQWCWEYQSQGVHPGPQEGLPFAPRFILPHLPSPLILLPSNGLDPEEDCTFRSMPGWLWTLDLQLTIVEVLVKFPNLFESQFPQLRVETVYLPRRWKDKCGSICPAPAHSFHWC